jgi:hypothetical protein
MTTLQFRETQNQITIAIKIIAIRKPLKNTIFHQSEIAQNQFEIPLENCCFVQKITKIFFEKKKMQILIIRLIIWKYFAIMIFLTKLSQLDDPQFRDL